MSIINQRRLARLQLLAWLALCGPGCGSNDHSGFGNPGTLGGSSSSGGGSGSGASSGSSGGSGSGGQTGFGTSSGSSGGSGGNAGDGGNDCAPGVGLYIYVISDQNTLYTFDPTMVPSAAAFQMVGPVTCPAAMGANVNSMAVDRQGVAWVNYGSPDGKIYKVSTTAPVTCQATSFANQQAGFTNELGMGFSSDAAGSTSETLYVSDNAGPGGVGGANNTGTPGAGKGLGKVDLTTMTLTPIGGYTGQNMGFNAELTGTSDAKLYGFFTTTPGDYSPIDKTTGATPPAGITGYPVNLPTVDASTGGYAFSFWGGDFYFYTQPRQSTTVTHYHTATQMAAAVMMDIGFTIVGAGVSTCAPRTGAPTGTAQ